MATGTPVDAVQQIANSLPDGSLKTALQKALSGSIGVIAKWISGYKYTGGDYALGEIFLNRVLGKETSSRWDTPDAVVPIAWMYFTQMFGLPIAVNTDLDQLRDHGDLEGYLQARPEQRGYVTQAQVTRAHYMLNLPALKAVSPYGDKYGPWPPSIFGAVPYVAPIPDARTPGALFNGTMFNGQEIVNGLPKTNATKGENITIDSGDGSGSSLLIYVVIAVAIIVLLILILSN